MSETFAGPIVLFLLVYVCDALFPCMFIICDSKHIFPLKLPCGNPLRTGLKVNSFREDLIYFCQGLRGTTTVNSILALMVL